MKQSEKVLGIILLLVLFAGANFILFHRVMKKKDAMELQHHELGLKRAEIEGLMEMKHQIFQYKDWLDANQPVYTKQSVAEAELLALANSSEGFEVDVFHRDLKDPVELPDMVEASIIIKCTGQLGGTLRWLYSLQKPDKFRVIQNFDMTPDKEDKTIVNCSFILKIWYRKKEQVEPSLSLE